MGLQNPVNYISDNPDNPFEQAKDLVSQKTMDVLSTETGQNVLDKSQPVLGALDWVAKGYRNYVAPALSTALMMSNAKYRMERSDQSLGELANTAWHDSLASVSDKPGEEWRRSISPGRALVGLIGQWAPGVQATDKIDWANGKEVQEVFSSGSAQFFSGVADLGFSFLDPALAVGKVAKASAVSRLARSVKAGGMVEKLSYELDDAVKGADNGAAELFKHVEDNTNDVGMIAAHHLIKNSSDPVLFATALRDANTTNGRSMMADVIKVSLGDTNAAERINGMRPSVLENIYKLNGTNRKITKTIKDLQDKTIIHSEMTADEIKVLEEANASLIKAKVDLADNRAKMLVAEAAKNVTEKVNEGLLGAVAGGTWAKNAKVERIRRAADEINYTSFFVENDPVANHSWTKQVAEHAGIKAPVVRSVMWLTPGGKLKENPAGIAYIAGAPGQRSFAEVDARIRKLGKLGKLSKQEQMQLASDYRKLSSKSDRFHFLENLERRSITELVLKHSNVNVSELTPKQQENLNYFVNTFVQQHGRAKLRNIGNIIDKNYVISDDTGNAVAVEMMRQHHMDLAKQLAAEKGRPVTDNDLKQVENMLKNVPTASTQIPNSHYTVDIEFFDKILSENPQAMKNVVYNITQQGWTKKDISSLLKTAEVNHVNRSGVTSTLQTAGNIGKVGWDVASEALDWYYQSLWKPMTLLSLKYTTRNVYEGWLRTAASMYDMHNQYGYSYSRMLLSETEGLPKFAPNVVRNMRTRSAARIASKNLDRKNQELLNKDIPLSRTFKGTTSGSKIAAQVQKNGFDAASRQEFESVDGLNIASRLMSEYFDKATAYAATSDVAAGNAARTISVDIANLLQNSAKHTVGTAGKFMQHLVEHKFDDAYNALSTADPVDVMLSLEKYSASLEKAQSMLRNHISQTSPIMKTIVDDLDYTLERVRAHTDFVKTSIAARANLIAEVSELAGKSTARGKLLRSYEGKKEIFPGVTIDSSLAGQAGEMLRIATSAKNLRDRTIGQENRLTLSHVTRAGFKRYAIDPTEKHWAAAHAEYVNNVIARDPVMKVVLEGKRDGLGLTDIEKNIKSFLKGGSPEALRWLREEKNTVLRFNNKIADYSQDDLIKELIIMTELYVPSYSLNTGKSFANSFDKILSGKYTAADSAMIPFAERHTVEGAVESSTYSPDKLWRNAVANVFQFIGSLPEDHLVRHPFFNMIHDAEAQRLTSLIVDSAKRKGVDPRELIIKNADNIKTASVNRAYKELMERLYSVERYTSPAHFLRWVSPFYMAAQNSTRFWLGISLRNPAIGYAMAKAYNAPFRAGYVQDENGNIVGSSTPWSASNESIVLHAPSFIREYTGRDVLKVNPKSIDVVTQGQFGPITGAGGPVGSTIAGFAVRYIAENKDVENWFKPDSFFGNQFGSYDKFVSKFIMPYYEKNYGKGGFDAVVQNLDPTNSWMLSSFAMFGAKSGIWVSPSAQERWNTRYNAARKTVMFDNMMNQIGMDPAQVEKQATELAFKGLMLESISAGVGPVVTTNVDDSRITEIRQNLKKLQNQFTPEEASVKMAQIINESYDTGSGSGILADIQSNTTANKLGLVGNNNTLRNVKNNYALIDKADLYYKDNPFIGELMNQVSKDNYYSQISDDVLYNIKVNGEPLKARSNDPGALEREAQYSAAWSLWFENKNYIEAHAAKNGIVPGTQAYSDYYKVWKDNLAQKIGEMYPLWATKEQKIVLQQSDRAVVLAQMFLNDSNFNNTVGKSKSGQINGLRAYIEGRNTIIEQLNANRAATGTQGLDTKANRYYLEWRNNFGQAVIKQYPEFKDMYNRYFIDDELNIVSSPVLEGVK